VSRGNRGCQIGRGTRLRTEEKGHLFELHMEVVMGVSDDAKNKAEDLKGRGKEAAGSLSGDDELKAEGKGDQASAGAKQKVTDAADAVKGKADDIKNKLTGH
jgi:uncharacterized protein YjbJ (UPF0337 family)